MDIVFRPHYFGGKNNNFDETFVPMSLKSVLKHNPNSNVHFISNDHEFLKKYFPLNPPQHLKCYTFDDLESDHTKAFDKSYIHLSSNQLLFEKYSILGYFSMYNLMCRLNLTEIIVVETDVLVFCNLNNVFHTHYDICDVDAILANTNTICCSYVKKIYLETFVNSCVKMYSTDKFIQCLTKIYNSMTHGGICDMTINDWIKSDKIYGGMFNTLNNDKQKINIIELSRILPDNSYFDDYLSNLKYGNGQFVSNLCIKHIYNINNKPFFKYGDVFIKCNSIHFQGSRKELIPEIYNKFII